jgi:hypothetical protein
MACAKSPQKYASAYTLVAVKRWVSMPKKSLKVDRKKFEGIVKNLLDTKPVKREDVKIRNRKNREKLIPPTK